MLKCSRFCCILLNFYIKPQPYDTPNDLEPRCILLNFYIKPQPQAGSDRRGPRCILLNFYIKPQPAPSFNTSSWRCILLNFYIKPQPACVQRSGLHCCILLNFYIKPQPPLSTLQNVQSCILLNFYIKPQQSCANYISKLVVSYWISTSNHNMTMRKALRILLYLIEFLHQTTTSGRLSVDSAYFAAVWWFPKSAFRSSAKSIWCLFSYFKEQI